MLLAAPKRSQRSQTLFMFMFTHMPYHTIPHRTMLTIPPYTPQKPTYGRGLATCIKSCVRSSFKLAPFHDAYVFHARSTSGLSICQLRLNKSKIRSLGYSCSWYLGALYIAWRWKSQKRSQTPKQLSNMLELNLERRIGPTNETGHVEFTASQSVWSRNKQQAKQA